MKTGLYSRLRRKIIVITLGVSLTPLLILGTAIYYKFSGTFKEKIEEQIRYRARAQAEAVDLFLKERTAILTAMADTHRFEDMISEKNLSRIFEVMNARAGAFVDLGVIDRSGQHLAYVGPYDLRGLNYFQQPWFAEVISKGVYVSDVYTGYRQIPHFIIAVRRQENEHSWILRSTIDPDIFGGIVRSAQVGKTGDAYIINKVGVYQTHPRFGGAILSESHLDPTLFGGRTTVVEEQGTGWHAKRLLAGSWLKNNQWLLVISEEAVEEMGGLFAARNMQMAVIACGVLAIILATIVTTHLTVSRLREADARMAELNAQLMQSDKLAALGKMAAGVAHEINNPLAVILQVSGWMDDLLADGEFRNGGGLEEFKKGIQKIETHVERARTIVHNMLGYARRMEPRLEDVDVNQTISQTIELLENYARINNIEIHQGLAADLPIIAGERAKLQQVFLNLVSNAIDAIGKDGAINVRSVRSGGEIHIKVADNGPGIPVEQRGRVFDPFFTTKETGKGTGLGLWVSYNIVEKMGGTITVDSEVGTGTSFTVKIPIVTPERK